MNELFKSGEGVVNTLHANVITSFNVSAFNEQDNYLDNYITSFNPIIKSSVSGFEGGTGLFLTFDPALKNYTKPYEIWYGNDSKGNVKFIDANANGVYLEAFQNPQASYMQFFFKSIKNKNHGIWTDVHYDPDIKKDVFGYCRSIYKDGLLLGVVGTTISTSDLYKTAKKMKIENDGYILLLNKNNQLMHGFTKKNEDYQSLTKAPKSLTQLSKPNYSGHDFTQVNGKKVLVTYSKLSNGWTFVIANNTNDIFKNIKSAQLLFTFFSILLPLIIVLFSYLAMKNYISPTEKAIDLLKTLDIDDDVKTVNHASLNNSDLEDVIKEHVKKQRAKDIHIAQISRQAEMGEMLETIMHQWKQPLNRINLIMGNLRDIVEHGEALPQDIILSADKTENTVSNMVQILDDFKGYMKPDSSASVFDVNEVVDATLTLLSYNIKKHNIKIVWEKDNSLPLVNGYKSALYHVLLNVISNGIEAISSTTTQNPLIEIRISKQEDKLLLKIFNTGSLLTQNVKDNLFQPYFTTKGSSGGSGMGLIISKNLLENTMGGTIELENKKNGVICYITIKYGGSTNV